MGVEAATYISQLVNTNPPSGDLTSQGDDHLRLIKAVLQATLPNASRAFYIPDTSAKTGNYNVLVTDENKFFAGDATGATFTFTLPTVGIPTGFSVRVIKTDSTLNAVNLTPSAGTINGAASIVLGRQYHGATVIWNGSTWLAFTHMTNVLTGDITFTGIVTFNDVVTFIQGIEFQGPLDIQSDAEVKGELFLTGQLKLGTQDLTDGASTPWDVSIAPLAKWTAAGNRTLAAPSGEEEGQFLLLKYTQDAAGNRVPTFNAAYKGPGGVVEMPDLGANAQTLYLGVVRGADDILIRRLWGSQRIPILGYIEYNLGDYAANTVYTQAHGLLPARYPTLVQVWAECTATDLGFAVGDRVEVSDSAPIDSGGGGNNSGISVAMNTTNIDVICTILSIHNKSTFIQSAATPAKWKIYARVFA